MANIGMTIQLLETFSDRIMWKEGFMTHEDNRETRIHICENAIETIKAQQAEIERINAVLKEQEEREKNICKRICDFIRGACSTDTDDDKDFVCYEIQKCFTEGR